MAQKVNVLLVDDLDGGEAHHTVPFELDGTTFEIDLSEDNYASMRDVLAPYIAAGRRVKALARGRRRDSARRRETRDIRIWAELKGIPLSDRGRIPAHVMADYEAEHNGSAIARTLTPSGGDVSSPTEMADIAPTASTAPSRGTSGPAAPAPFPDARTWARDHRLPVPARGRLSGSVMARYEEAKAAAGATTPDPAGRGGRRSTRSTARK